MPFAPTEFTQVNAGDQPRARAPRAGAARPAAGRARRRLLLRARQLHAADRAPRRARSSASRAARRWSRARRRTPRATASRERATLRGREPVRGDAPDASRRSARSTASLIDPPREGAIELVKALPQRDDGGALAADRLRVVQSGDARARRGGAGPRARLPAARRGRRQHVSAHRARRVDRACSIALTRRRRPQKKRGESPRPVQCCWLPCQSRCPENASSRLQQADEDVVDVEEQVQRRHDVVRLAAAHDVAQVVQQVQREDQHGDRRDRHATAPAPGRTGSRATRRSAGPAPTNRNLPRNAKSRLRHRGDRRHARRKSPPSCRRPARPAARRCGSPRATVRIGVSISAGDEREAEQRRHAPRAVAQRA